MYSVDDGNIVIKLGVNVPCCVAVIMRFYKFTFLVTARDVNPWPWP